MNTDLVLIFKSSFVSLDLCLSFGLAWVEAKLVDRLLDLVGRDPLLVFLPVISLQLLLASFAASCNS